jgi:hypothetical protein
MAERGYFQPFVVDDDNREIITQMWYYIIGSEQCRWDINKGIFMGGKVGCGKTILMHAFCEVLHFISGRTVEMIPAQELCQMIAEKGFDGFASRPLLIDEIGRETLEMNAFGNKIIPSRICWPCATIVVPGRSLHRSSNWEHYQDGVMKKGR